MSLLQNFADSIEQMGNEDLAQAQHLVNGEIAARQQKRHAERVATGEELADGVRRFMAIPAIKRAIESGSQWATERLDSDAISHGDLLAVYQSLMEFDQRERF